MMQLARKTVRARPRTFVSAFIALLAATAMVTASGVLVESGARGGVAPDRYAGVPIVVAGEQDAPDPVGSGDQVTFTERNRIPASLADVVAGQAGVRSVVIDRSVPATASVDGRILAAADLETHGYGWSSAALWPVELRDGREPRARMEVVLDAALAASGPVQPGDSLRITSTNGAATYEVVGIVTPMDVEHRRRTAPLFFTDATARSLAIDGDRADALGVFLESDADARAVARALRDELGPGLAVLTGGARSGPESLEIRRLNRELVDFGVAFGITTVLLAILVIAATLGLAIIQRGREIALLRAVGATPGQVRRMVLGETLVIAIVAGALGAIPGLLLGAALFRVLADAGIIAPHTTVRMGPLPALVAISVALAASGLAALLAARRATRIRPVAALAEAAVEPSRVGWFRLLLGVALTGGGLALSVAAGTVEGEEGAALVVLVLLMLILGVVLLGPLLARGAGWLARPLLALGSRANRVLVGANIRMRARRMASASIPLALVVSLSLTMIGSLATEATAAARDARDRLIADRVIEAPGGVAPGLVEGASVPGLAAAVELYPTQIGVIRSELFGEQVFERRPAAAASAEGVGLVLDLDVRDGSLDALGAGTVALSTELARTTGAGPGDDITLWLGDGSTSTFRVVAVYARSLGLGDFLITRDDALPHLTVPMASQVLVRFTPDADPAALDDALSSLRDQVPGLTVQDREAVDEAFTQAAAEGRSVNYLFVAVLTAFVAISMVNSLVLATAERARELALLRLVGATHEQVMRTIRFEALVLVAYGTLLGLIVAAATLVPFSLGIAGTPVPSIPLPLIVGVVIGAALTGTLAMEIPARLLLRRPPIEVVSARA